ncbi:MAG: GMC family oxidoreductase [Azospirillaceae bacterium]
MIADFDKTDGFETVETDLCIVGAGIAGLTLAHALADSGMDILILEGGGEADEARSQDLYRIDTPGVPHDGAANGRFRVLGGSSTRWGGQLLPMQPLDFAARGWVPGSGWPIPYDAVSRHFAEAHRIMHVPDPRFDGSPPDGYPTGALALDRERFRMRHSRWAPFGKRNLALTLGPILAEKPNIRILVHANAVALETGGAGRHVDAVRVRGYDGREARVCARRVVLAGGTIETARLLLDSTDADPQGLGNGHDLVGRYFQDHLSLRAATLAPPARSGFRAAFEPVFRKGVMYSPKLELSEAAQRAHRSLYAMGHVVFETPEDSGLYEVRKILQARQSKTAPIPSPEGMWRILRDLPDVWRAGTANKLGGRVRMPRRAEPILYIDTEQAPDPDSRVSLGRDTDALGMRKAVLDWRLGAAERDAARLYARLFAQAWREKGLGEVRFAESLFDDARWLETGKDAYHQLGTTRMGRTPEEGVVDPDLRVHGVDNLWVASCAVFPTSGGSNPTLTMMALTLRLAEHLTAEAAAPAAGIRTGPAAAEERSCHAPVTASAVM